MGPHPKRGVGNTGKPVAGAGLTGLLSNGNCVGSISESKQPGGRIGWMEASGSTSK